MRIAEPTPEQSLADPCAALRERLEAHHRLHITDDALRKAVALSVRYIGDRWLPDKAIDLVDEAASRVRMQALVQPERGARAGDAADERDRGHGKRRACAEF